MNRLAELTSNNPTSNLGSIIAVSTGHQQMVPSEITVSVPATAPKT
jgi:hypothetical protein